jgi:hypothetical protein
VNYLLRLVCWFLGHRWVIEYYEIEPMTVFGDSVLAGRTYELHVCRRCDAQPEEHA